MNNIPPFTQSEVEAICKIIGDTEHGLTGSEIGRLLESLGFTDVDPQLTKWKRLVNAIGPRQNNEQSGEALRKLIEGAMDPQRFINNRDLFESQKDKLNTSLSFKGYEVGENGRLRSTSKASSLSDAEEKANRLRKKLTDRNIHIDVLKVCESRFLKKDYFYAVLEATKSIRNKIRKISELDADGHSLIDQAFEAGKKRYPMVAFNTLESESERNEQKGLIHLMRGISSAFRNPSAHESESMWKMSEQDALDLLTFASFIHRKLDNNATKVPPIPE